LIFLFAANRNFPNIFKDFKIIKKESDLDLEMALAFAYFIFSGITFAK